MSFSILAFFELLPFLHLLTFLPFLPFPLFFLHIFQFFPEQRLRLSVLYIMTVGVWISDFWILPPDFAPRWVSGSPSSNSVARTPRSRFGIKIVVASACGGPPVSFLSSSQILRDYQERISERTQIVDAPTLQELKETVEIVRSVLQEQVQQRTAEHIEDAPQFLKDTVEVLDDLAGCGEKAEVAGWSEGLPSCLQVEKEKNPSDFLAIRGRLAFGTGEVLITSKTKAEKN